MVINIFRIADRYFLGIFIKILFFATVSFILIFVIVSIIEHIDVFIDREASIQAIIVYYYYSLPNFFILILPVAMLMASLFTMAQFVKHGELTALKSAGTSLYRIALPVFVLAFLVSVLAFWFGEMVVPVFEREKSQLYQEQIKKIPIVNINQYNIVFQETNNRLVNIGHYDGYKHTGSNINIQKLNNNIIESTISANSLIPDGEMWILKNGIVRDFSSGEEVIEEFSEKRILDFSFSEDDLIAVQIKPEEMNVFELNNYIQKLRQMGSPFEHWLVDYHKKFAFPFANLIVILIGLPLATSKWKGGTAVGFGICLLICFIYYVIMTFTQALGYKGVLSPVTAAWFSNAFFGILGVAGLITAKK